LELTVRHFHNLKRQNKFYIKSEQSYADRFRDGFSQCAKEVTKFLYNSQQNRAGEHIIVHLNDCIRRLDGLTNGTSAGMHQIVNNNNNNYIQNDLQMDLNHPQQAAAAAAAPQLVHHQNIRQPIPLLRKSPTLPPQNYLSLPLQPQLGGGGGVKMEPRLIDDGSPLLMRPISRESLSSSSASSSPSSIMMMMHQQSPKDEGPVWRPW